MAGLTAARALSADGRRVCVVDKGRGVGGRMATRRIADIRFDHGAQYFTARHPEFAALCREWEADGTIRRWFEEQGEPRYVATGGMNSLAKHLAKGLHVRLQAKAVRIEREGELWRVVLENGEEIFARSVVATAPAEQTLSLISHLIGGEARQVLSSIGYQPCFALLARLEGPSRLPAPGFVRPGSGPIAWMADNAMRLRQGEDGAVTIHATPEFSWARFHDPLPEVEQDLLHAAAPWLGSGVVERQTHRWRYALVSRPAESPCLLACDHPPLIVAGDGFGGARVEGAWLSGRAAYDLLTES